MLWVMLTIAVLAGECAVIVLLARPVTRRYERDHDHGHELWASGRRSAAANPAGRIDAPLAGWAARGRHRLRQWAAEWRATEPEWSSRAR